MNKLNITSYRQIDHITLHIRKNEEIIDVEFKGNGINTFRSIFNKLEADLNSNVSNQPSPSKKIVIDSDHTIKTSSGERIYNSPTSGEVKRPLKKKETKKIVSQPLVNEEEIEMIEPVEDMSEYDVEPTINLERNNRMNLNYAPVSGGMSAIQMGKNMAQQSGLEFR